MTNKTRKLAKNDQDSSNARKSTKRMLRISSYLNDEIDFALSKQKQNMKNKVLYFHLIRV